MEKINQSEFLNTLYKLAEGTIEVETGDEIEVTINDKTLKIKIEEIDKDPVAIKQEADNNRVDKAPRIRDLGDVKVAYIDDRYFNEDYQAIEDFIKAHDIDIVIDKKFEGIIEVENITEMGCVEFTSIDVQKLDRTFGFSNLYIGTDEFSLVYGYDGYQDVVISVNDKYTIQYDIQENEGSSKLNIKACKKHRVLKNLNKTQFELVEDDSEDLFNDETNITGYEGIVCFKEEDRKIYPNSIVVADKNLTPYTFVAGPIELSDKRGYMLFKMYKDDVMINYHLAELTVYDGAPESPFNIKILNNDDYHFEIWEQDDYLLICAVLDDHQINIVEGEQE